MRRDDFIKGSPENPWPEVFAEFSAQIRQHVGPALDLFLPDFSTTGPVERAASEVVLLGAMRSYFAYEVMTLCGIPEITLEGTPEDWRAVAERARRFAGLDLGWWLEALEPVLDQFARASRGEVDRPFWQSLYRLHDESGGPLITGWIMAFFPYLKDGRTGQATQRNPWLTEESQRLQEDDLDDDEDDEEDDRELGESEYYGDGPTLEMLPGGLSLAPFRWDYLGRSLPMEFLGGFVGVRQDAGTLALRPEIGWAMREAEGSA